MTDPTARYTIGNLIAIVAAMLLSAGLAAYALSGEATGRIGRHPEGPAITGVVGALIAGWALIKGIRSRRRQR